MIQAYRFLGRTTLTFGNYKGLTYEQVFKEHRDYCGWAIKEHLHNIKNDRKSGELGRLVDFCYFADNFPQIFDP